MWKEVTAVKAGNNHIIKNEADACTYTTYSPLAGLNLTHQGQVLMFQLGAVRRQHTSTLANTHWHINMWWLQSLGALFSHSVTATEGTLIWFLLYQTSVSWRIRCQCFLNPRLSFAMIHHAAQNLDEIVFNDTMQSKTQWFVTKNSYFYLLPYSPFCLFKLKI